MSLSNAQAEAGSGGSPIDVGLLVLRLGVGFSFVILLSLEHAEAQKTFPGAAGYSWPLVALLLAAVCLALGFLTETAAAVLAALWMLAALSELRAGDAWVALPVRAVEYAFLCAALGITGPGKYSLDCLLAIRRKNQAAPSA